MINYFNALVCYEITVFVCLLLLQSVSLSFIPRIVTITRSRYFWKSENIDAKHEKTILTILDKQTKREESRYVFIRIYYLWKKMCRTNKATTINYGRRTQKNKYINLIYSKQIRYLI